MRIEEVEAFKFGGALYETRAKAEDAAQDRILRTLRGEFYQHGFTVTDVVKIMDVLLAHREFLADALDY